MKEVFFGEKGLTTTSANTIANMAKEYIQTLEVYLNNIGFITTKIGLISSSEQKILKDGISEEELMSIPQSLKEISEAKALIAWLREAIKAKELLKGNLNVLTLSEYVTTILKEEYPEEPERKHILTEEEYWDSMPIKSRNRYYQLETECAVLGKYIHPNGAYSEARKEMKNKIKNPHSLNGTGRDSILYEHTPSVETQSVEDMFFALQQQHREVQKQLNSMKFECEKTIEDSENEANSEFSKDYTAYTNRVNIYAAKKKEYQRKESSRIGNLKIIIPDSLVAIYEKIANLGK